MTPAQALRAAADAVDSRVVSEREARVILLMAYHISRRCEAREDEARLLMALLDETST